MSDVVGVTGRVLAVVAIAVSGVAAVGATAQASGHGSVTQPHAIPVITSLSTTTVSQDETATETVTGSGFLSGATLSAGPGVVASVTAVTPTQLVATLHVRGWTTVGRRTVTITNPDRSRAARRRALRIDYAPIFARWAVGDGAVSWTTMLRRPTFAVLPTLSLSGAGVTVASEHRSGSGQVAVGFTIASGAAATWRTMTIVDGTSSWVVPRALKVRLAPTITSFPPLKQGAAYQTVLVKGANFEVCAEKDPTVTISGTGATVNMASTALGDLMYVNVSVDPAAAVGPRDVTMTNCDSGGTATSVGVFTVKAA